MQKSVGRVLALLVIFRCCEGQLKSKELEDKTLVITTYSLLSGLYIDGGAKIPTLPNGDNWKDPDYVQMASNSRLIAFRATNVESVTCGGVLASVEGNFLTSTGEFKCITSSVTDWTQLGFDDSSWPNAVEYGDNTNGQSNCKQQRNVTDINPNAKWIWTSNLANTVIYCRGYTSVCETSSPCLNNGNCDPNSPQMCVCLPQFTGEFCETDTQATIAPTESTTTIEEMQTTTSQAITTKIPTESITTIEEIKTTIYRECPPGFTITSNNHCYNLQVNVMIWENARSTCNEYYPGAHLVVISDANEQSDINALLSRYNVSVWTSGRRETDSCGADFVWKPSTDVQHPLTYTNWYSGEPNCFDSIDEFCIELTSYGTWRWNDQKCSFNSPSLCEFDLATMG